MKFIPSSKSVAMHQLPWALVPLLIVGCQTTPPPRLQQPNPGLSQLQQAITKREQSLPIIAPQQVNKPTTGPLLLAREEAVLMAMKNNRALYVQQLTPKLKGAFEELERARFDTKLYSQASYGTQVTQPILPGLGNLGPTEVEQTKFETGFTKRFSTGTQIDVNVSETRTQSNNQVLSELLGTPPPFPIPAPSDSDTTSTTHQFRTGLTLTQALLRGFGPGANLARVRQAEAESLASAYQLRGFTENLVTRIESLYWDYYLAERRIEIVKESLALADQQQQEITQRINVGRMAGVELPAAQAEVALRRQQLIDANSIQAQLRLRLLQLVNPQGREGWERDIKIADQPNLPSTQLSRLEDHVELALKNRADLNEARLQLQTGELQLVQTRNGLLPQMNLFMTLGKSGYADSFSDSTESWKNFSDASDAPEDRNYWDGSIGVRGEYPWGNREAKSIYRQAQIGRDQRELGVENLEQLAVVDTRSAYLDVLRATEQIEATRATKTFQVEALRAETEKFQVGRSTSTLVARAQRDAVSSRLQEVQSIVDLHKALLNLYRTDGTLLKRRGIGIEGTESPLPQVAKIAK